MWFHTKRQPPSLSSCVCQPGNAWKGSRASTRQKKYKIWLAHLFEDCLRLCVYAFLPPTQCTLMLLLWVGLSRVFSVTKLWLQTLPQMQQHPALVLSYGNSIYCSWKVRILRVVATTVWWIERISNGEWQKDFPFQGKSISLRYVPGLELVLPGK